MGKKTGKGMSIVMGKYTVEDIMTKVKEENVHYLRLMFTDILGMIKNVEVPISQLQKVLDNKLMFDGSSIEGFVRIEESDMYLHPDLDTWLVFPWEVKQGKIARFICDVYQTDGTPFPGDPRSNLKRMLKKMEDMGFTEFNLGPEPEFFLFKLDENDKPSLDLNDEGGYFDLAPNDLGEDCRRDIVLELEALGFEIEASHHEVASGQHEIDWKYSSAIEACDNIQTFKLIVKTVARKHGLHATFMPKPVYGINGSGMHCNMSLFNEKGNAFFEQEDENQLSTTAYQFIAGLLKHAPGYTAICNPIVNSYKRLVPGFEAPVYIAWSTQNRSPLVRIPNSRGLSTRVELRSVDPSTNPYLALAVLLAAGLNGIQNNLPVPAPIDRNIYTMNKEERYANDIHDLPKNLGDALIELSKDQLMLDALGEHISQNFIEAKEIEVETYIMQVTEWEKQQYLNIY